MLDPDPEMAAQITMSVKHLRAIGDDLQIVRLLLSSGSSTSHTITADQLLDRLQHAYLQSPVVLPPQALPDVIIRSDSYDVVALLVRVVGTLPRELPDSPIVIRVRPHIRSEHLVVQVGCTLPDAAIASETVTWIRSILTAPPATKHTTLTMRVQMLASLFQAYAWSFQCRSFQAKIVFRVMLPVLSSSCRDVP